RELLDSLTLTAYAWSDGRPLDWGAGGPDAWPQSQPYHTPQGAQDQRGFRIFEWYEALTERILGSSLPILAVAGGARGEADGSGAINANIAKLLRDPDNAQSLMAICFEAMPREADRDAWFVDERQEKASASAAAKVVSATGSAKTFAHYLLLPTEESQAVPAWRKASAFALTHRPVVGFSPTEAALAEQVTIAAGPDVIPD
ncbi:MAG: hypothetical protein GWO39_03660, partial [Gammaproteobacteria bacterium]|nr:hypothetical protein [Gammaproteobacteria bacterium]NIT62914.1 hypothetical protein [Gammaproteobacteria bacterium]NIY31494.1 hypothetical protein [Gammaproteobacteria bacterium]